MSKYDPALEADNARRQAELKANPAYQRGVAQAKAANLQRVRAQFEAELGRLKRATLNRDDSQAARDHYNIVHALVVRAAENLALATGEAVSGVPRYLPPPEPTPEETITIGVPKPAAEPIPTTMRDKGEALTSLPVFGSMLDAQLREAGVVK